MCPKAIRIERVAAGSVHHVTPVDVALNPAVLIHLQERTMARIVAALTAGGVEAACQEQDIAILAPTQWGGIATAPELLAAFVRPK